MSYLCFLVALFHALTWAPDFHGLSGVYYGLFSRTALSLKPNSHFLDKLRNGDN